MAKPPDEWAGLDARIAEREKLARTFDCQQCGAKAGEYCVEDIDSIGDPDDTSPPISCGRRYRLALEQQRKATP
jgi:hypothetical protein